MEEAITQAPGFELTAGMIIGYIVLIAWSLVWKAIALWKSARLGSKVWFVVLLIVNTLGILEIIYIFVVARPKEKEPKIPGAPPVPKV